MTASTDSAANQNPSVTLRSTRSRWIGPVIVAIIIMAITMLPYLAGAGMEDGRQFMWLGYNLDDSCVYLSWMRQAADGATRALNLFTTDPQHGMALNPLFLVLGRIAGWTGIPLIGVYHGARLLFGLTLLLMVWRLLQSFITDRWAQWLAFLFVSFSAGLGWLPIWWEASPLNTPIDKWQPEAITYLSLYLSPLFCASLCLQVAIFMFLYRGLNTRSPRYAIFAGLCGFLLGLIHTYDVISVSAVWLAYLVVLQWTKSMEAQSPLHNWKQALLAGLITSPAVGYIYWQMRTEVVFQKRADVATLSTSLLWVIAGYGLTLLLAVLGSIGVWKSSVAPSEATGLTKSRKAGRFLIVWAIVNVFVSYLPFAFQRKLI